MRMHRRGLARGAGRRTLDAGEQRRLADQRAGPGDEVAGRAVVARVECDRAAAYHIAAVRAVALAKQHVAGAQHPVLGREGDEAQRVPVEQVEQRRPGQDRDVVLERHQGISL